uniref:Thrombomodulin n=1 Tax=Labrus bergylta TaxID=56723 RepID=A0A3Q3G5C4_9LABR
MEPNSGYCIGNQCFTVFRDVGDYSTAQKQCRDLSGHLMTVRSSVSHDVLFILLGNFTGRYWIGLNLPTGCPDVAADLKGFQWVTKDSESDFFNWVPGFDSSCSSRRCVSVSREDDFKWIQEPCEEHREGFLCEHGIKEPIAIRMPAETKYVCVSEQWLQCVSAPCEHMCTNTHGSYSCSCYDGYKEDSKEPHRCKRHCGKEECVAECDPNNKFQCFCPEGYITDERGAVRMCIDMDECQFFYCDQTCKNTFGSYVCSCHGGYTLVNEFRCEKNDDTDSDGGSEGSGAYATLLPTAPPVTYPNPTRQPSRVTVGGLVGIIVCTVLFVVLLVFLVYHILSGKNKMESAGALKAPEGETHDSSDV